MSKSPIRKTLLCLPAIAIALVLGVWLWPKPQAYRPITNAQSNEPIASASKHSSVANAEERKAREKKRIERGGKKTYETHVIEAAQDWGGMPGAIALGTSEADLKRYHKSICKSLKRDVTGNSAVNSLSADLIEQAKKDRPDAIIPQGMFEGVARVLVNASTAHGC